jgi:hypothetical protein
MKQEKDQVMKSNKKSYGESFAHILQQYCYFVMAEKKNGLEVMFGLKFHTKISKFLALEVRKLLVSPCE